MEQKRVKTNSARFGWFAADEPVTDICPRDDLQSKRLGVPVAVGLRAADPDEKWHSTVLSCALKMPSGKRPACGRIHHGCSHWIAGPWECQPRGRCGRCGLRRRRRGRMIDSVVLIDHRGRCQLLREQVGVEQPLSLFPMANTTYQRAFGVDQGRGRARYLLSESACNCCVHHNGADRGSHPVRFLLCRVLR
jgi:hypothetical protein